MKDYFKNPAPFIVTGIFPTFLLGTLGIGLISTGQLDKLAGGAVCLFMLALFLWWAISQAKTPAVRIHDDVIEIRDLLGGVRRVDDVRTYQLVVSNQWIGFRRAGQQDVMIDKGRFSKKTWRELEDHLRKLPVAGVI